MQLQHSTLIVTFSPTLYVNHSCLNTLCPGTCTETPPPPLPSPSPSHPPSPFPQLLGYSHHANKECNRSYLLTTEDGVVGGFGKYPDSHPGTYVHAYVCAVIRICV